MTVKYAKEATRQWVMEEASTAPNVFGAFYHGSINELPDAAELPATSDVDVMVVLTDDASTVRLGKFVYRNVLLEVSALHSDRVASAERILGDYHLAGSFRKPGIILDPSGRLTELQAIISRDFAKRFWVRKRCEHARNNVLNMLDALNESVPLSEQVTVWLFATGVTTHILLVAGLKNPTVRRRYAAVRELLSEYGFLEFYEPLLEMLGCAEMSRERVQRHLAALADAFDDAKAVIQTPYRFAADMSDLARPVAIDGSRELIERGLHREALFWIIATYSRCQWVLHHDAPAAMQKKHDLSYHLLLTDLGVATFADRQRRGEQVREFLPQVWQVAETIIAANPEVE